MKELRGSLLRVALIVALALGLSSQAWSQEPAQASPISANDGQWHFLVGLYGWFPAIQGTVSLNDYVQVPINVSFSDLWSHLKMVAPLHFEARHDLFGLATDVLYIRMGAPIQGNIPQYLNASVDLRTWIVEGFGFYRVAHGSGENPWTIDLLGGVRYWNINARAESDIGNTSTLTTDWVDGFGGLRFQVPIVGCLSLLGRGDVGAGGAKLDWSASGDLALRLGKHWVSGLGWKYLSVDYAGKAGPLGSQRVFDVAFNGPLAWIVYTW